MNIRVSAPAIRLPFPLASVRRVAGAFLKVSGVSDSNLSIVFLTEKAMRGLNRKSLGHDYVTDVVTFDLSDKIQNPVPGILDGEIYICPAEARRNAKLFGETLEREVLRYVAHGILHLLGHDDRGPEDRRKMRIHEDRFLAALIPAKRKCD